VNIEPQYLLGVAARLDQLAATAGVELNGPAYQTAGQYVAEYHAIVKELADAGCHVLAPNVRKVTDFMPNANTLDNAALYSLRTLLHGSRSLAAQLRTLAQPIVASRDALATIKSICMRFHRLAVQLTRRHGGRQPFRIEDEYDVQDLLHALLLLQFDDIRVEEWTPSYAGGSSRMDFLLKQHKLVLETKMTRAGLGAKEVGEQLLIDIARYGEHPDCQALVCFVYDPGALIPNPRGVEADLARASRKPVVRAFIRPTGE
jgi:hypothetical protein